MSEFSYLLSQHIHSKNIKTYALAQYCSLDRSNMYKVINGKRKPSSIEMVRKMSKFMHLSPAEERELEEAFEITLAGYDNYYRRKEVLQFFFGFNLAVPSIPAGKYTPINMSAIDDIVLLNSASETNHAIFQMVIRELSEKDGNIRLLLQPEYEFLMNLLQAEGSTECTTQIEHIMCLNNNSDIVHTQKNYNLKCLKQILPLYGSCRGYKCFYYYDNIISKTGSFSLFPYMVITSQFACILTADIERGVLTKLPSAVEMLNEIFNSYLAGASPLLKRIDNAPAQLSYINELVKTCTPAYSFQMTPCLTPFLTSAFMEKYISQDIPEREQFLSQLKNYVTERTNNQIVQSYIFSLDGLISFFENGIIGEYPKGIYNPPDISDRVHIIKQLLSACKSQKYRMLKNNIGSLENELFLFVSQKRGYLMFSEPYTKELVYLDIEEPGLLFAFFDFCENLNDDLFYSPEEAAALIESLLNQLRQRNLK